MRIQKRIYTHKDSGERYLVTNSSHAMYVKRLGNTLLNAVYEIEEFESATVAYRAFCAWFDAKYPTRSK